MRNRRTLRAGWAGVVAVVAMFAIAACDFEVSNPGPVPDTQLNDPGSHAGLVQGASFALSIALWQVSYIGSEATREITRSGRNFCCPKAPSRVGEMRRTTLDAATWNVSQRARWVAEDATRRFAEVLEGGESSYEFNARVKLLAGYANRLLAENMCVGVIDGSGVLDHGVYAERAEQAFTDAIAIGGSANVPEVVTAAYAGRASVRGAWLGDWAGAVSDAGNVPRGFTYQAVFSGGQSNQYNQLFALGSGDDWRDWTVHGSDFETYYTDTGDPRAAWEDLERSDSPEGLPLYRQAKFTSRGSGVNLSSGREMLLIQAEAALNGVGGDWQDAMDILNDLRSDVISDNTDNPLPALTAANEEEAWGHLKQERRVELWLEGRTMGDLRRWIEDGTPGDQPDMSDRVRLCFPIATTEVNSNPEIDSSFEEPLNPIYTGS